jgi:hypothetical protein
VDIRSRANTTMGLDFEHMIKARAHKGGVFLLSKMGHTEELSEFFPFMAWKL